MFFSYYTTWSVVCIITILLLIVRRWKNVMHGASGKEILITGCDSGIGLQAALFFDRLGCVVFAGCLKPDGQGADVLRREASRRLVVLDLDVTDRSKVTNAAKFVRENSSGLWCLMNNAGICVGGDLEWQTWEQCEKQVAVNLLGTISMIKVFAPMIKKSNGRIVNISSVNGRWAYPGISVYSATKFAIEGLSEALRGEMATFGVQVVVVAPGDHARHTNIMKMQKEHTQAQWTAMSDETRKELGNTFWKVQDYMCQHAGLSSPDTFEESPLLGDLQLAVLASYPKARYTSTSLKYRIIFCIAGVMPTEWKDLLINLVRKIIFKHCKVTSS